MELNEAAFREKLEALDGRSTSIEGTSAWVCYHRAHAHRVATIWEDVFGRASQAKRLLLIYLANDIIQNSLLKRTSEFAAAFFRVLPQALRHMLARSDEATRRRVRRVAEVWINRRVFGRTGTKTFVDLLEESTTKPALRNTSPPNPEPVSGLLESAIGCLQAARDCHVRARGAEASLAGLPVAPLDPETVARLRDALSSRQTTADAEAEAMRGAAAHPLIGGSDLLVQAAAAATQAARSAGSRLAELDRTTMTSPRSPEPVIPSEARDPAAGAAEDAGTENGTAVAPVAAGRIEDATKLLGGEAAALAAELAGKPPEELLNLLRDLDPTQQALLTGVYESTVPAQHYPVEEEYDPDNPF